ncbi:bifunctional apoptosis regulator-like [Gouania willdenowi]|uniref:bifunctional apoptosis regulator-like n=1 Tax=Gouania willdenowi TaxID=441366 RepID=UPI001055600D|nr:bifunctional apoptosis regulator-like [Gouania willdenowi]
MRLRNRTYGSLQQPVKFDQQVSSRSKVCGQGRQQILRNPKQEPAQSEQSTSIRESDFSCHCCYDILLDPTTLSCGHSFCRHCVAQWWNSSKKKECPECREKWQDFPKTNILLRNATDKLFSDAINRRKAEIESNCQISHTLHAFQRFGNNLRQTTDGNRFGWSFGFGILTVLVFVVVLMLMCHGSSCERNQQKKLSCKAVPLWTAEEILYRLEQMGPWTHPYRKTFLQKKANGRVLLLLGEEELIQCLYRIDNKTHRQALLDEFERVKPPKYI